MSANPMHDAMTRNESPRAPDNAHLMCDRATQYRATVPETAVARFFRGWDFHRAEKNPT
jgi:hypothetical protein